jgi:ankyrin repeat protein
VQIVLLLIEQGMNINQVCKSGLTGLHNACRWENSEVVCALLKQGININLVDSLFEYTAFDYACEKKNLEIVQVLIEHGIDINRISKTSRLIRTWLKVILDSIRNRIIELTDIKATLYELFDLPIAQEITEFVMLPCANVELAIQNLSRFLTAVN